MVHSLIASRNLKKKVSGEEASIVNQIESAQISIKEMITNVELSNQDSDQPGGQPSGSQVKAPHAMHTIPGVLEKLGPWFESRLKEKNVSLDVSGASVVHPLSGPADAFVYQVFMNLLSNAVKFTPADGQVCIESGADPEGRIYWSITDPGAGITPEAFTVHTIPQSGTGGERGSGLGLKIVRSFADDNGIEVLWLSKQMGEGRGGFNVPDRGARVVLLQRRT